VGYRVDELAARCGVSVDTVRFYQTRGLLPPPDREGRIAWYSDEHLERLRRIRDLKRKGFTLGSIRRLLAGELDAADEALVAAVVGGEAASEDDALLSREELAGRIGVPPDVIAVVEQENLIEPRVVGGVLRYTAADVEAARAGLALLEAGVPLPELLALARAYDAAARATAERAVDLFDRYVREQVRATSPDEREAGERLVAAFNEMLPATTRLVAHHFRRVLLAAAQARIEGVAQDGGAVREPA